MDVSHVFHSLHNELASDKAKDRKEGLKRLTNALDSDEVLAELNRKTLRLHALDSITADTWPGLANILAGFTLKEVEQSRSKKRGPEAGISKVFRKFIQCAEDVRRSGRSCMLQRWAGKLFVHVCKVIKLAGLGSQIGMDYGTVLRTQLLLVPQYCAAASSITFQELLSMYMDKLEAGLDRSEESFRAVVTLQQLMQQFPGDMDPLFQQDTIAHFRLMFQQLNELREDSRISVAFLTAVNTFLLSYGLDVFSRLRDLHSAMHPFVVRTWGTARDAKLREGLVAYLRIQIRLGAIQESASTMSALQESVERDLASPSFSLIDEARHGKPGISRQQRAFLTLAGELLMQNALSQESSQRSSGRGSAVALQGEDSLPAAKKRRVNYPLAVLQERALQSPAIWAPVLAVGLQRFGADVPTPVYLQYLDALSAVLQSGRGWPLAAATLNSDEACDNEAIAFLYLVRQLAAAWPACLVLPAGPAMHTMDVDTANTVQRWQIVCDAVIKWLQETSTSAECQEQGLQALVTISGRRLCPLLIQQPALWDLPALKVTPLSPAALQLIAEMLQYSSGSSAEELAQCQQMLQRVLPAEFVWQPPASTAAAVLALMKAKGSTMLDQAVSLEQSSCWDSFNAAFEQGLGLLVRGVEFTKQKATEYAKQHASDPRKLSQARSLVPPSALQQEAGWALLRWLQQATGSKMPDAIALHQLLGSCATAATCLACIQERHSRIERLLIAGEVPQLESYWQLDGSLAGALQQALKRSAALLTVLCGNGEVIPAMDVQQLAVLVRALKRLSSQGSSQIVSRGLDGVISELERIFRDADEGEVARMASQAGSANDTSQSDMFDDDLDMGGGARVLGRAGRPASASASPAAYVRQSQAVQLLKHLGVVQPAAAANALLRLYEHSETLEDDHEDRIQPPAELMLELVDALGSVVAGVDPRQTTGTKGTHPGIVSLQGGLSPISQIGGASQLMGRYLDCLCLPRFMAGYHNPNLLVITRHLQEQAEALSSAWVGGGDGRPQHVDDAIDSIATVLHHMLDHIHKYQEKTQVTAVLDGFVLQAVVTTGQLRVQLARTIMALAALESRLLLGDMLQDCLELVVGLLQDDRYQARQAASKLALQVLKTWHNVEHIFSELLGKLTLKGVGSHQGSREAKEEHLETSVVILGEMGLASASVELQAVYHLCSHAAHFQLQMPLVRAVLESMATRCNYRCLPAYIAFHFHALMFSWYTSNHTLDQLLSIQGLVATKPEHAGGEPKAFLASTAKELVPVMLLDQRLEELQQMADLLGCTLRQLLEQSFYSIMGTFYPYVTTGDEEDKQLVKKATQEGIMATQFTGEQIDSMLAAHIVNIFGAMLLTAGPIENPARPFFPIHTVLASIRKIVDSSDPHSGEQYLWHNILAGDGIQRLLLVVHEQLHRARHEWHQRQSLAPLRALVDLLGDRVHEAPTFRYLLHILIRLLGSRGVQKDVCSLLESLLGRMLKKPERLAVLGPLLQPLLFGLAESIDAEVAVQGTNDLSAQHPLSKLLFKLTIRAPPELHEFLRRAEPLPGYSVFSPAQELHEQLRQGVSLADELHEFASRVGSMSLGLRQRSMELLRQTLDRRRHELLSADGTSVSAACRPVVEEAAWKLVSQSGELGDEELAALAGQLLALLGPLDHTIVAFSAPGINTLTATEPQKPRSLSAAVNALLAAALQQLCAFLIDEDVSVITLAQYTLRKLLGMQPGKAALATLDDVAASYLRVYLRPDDAPTQQDVEAAPSFDALMAKRKLWQIGSQGYSVWLCNLAGALLSRTKSPTLQVCRKMVQAKLPFAELIFPFILLDLASHDNGDLWPLLTARLDSCIYGQQTDAKAVALMLSALNFLRTCRLTAMEGEGEKRRSKKEAPKDPILLGMEQNPPAQWPKVYWLGLDYLKVASAALRSSACFMALLYIEEWCKETHGELSLGEDKLRDEDTLPVAEQLLLDIFSQVNEPDGIYAIARSHKMASQLRLFEHEGSWSKALLGYDLLQQSAVGRPPAVQKMQHEQGAMHALRQLGCQNAMQGYLAGLGLAKREGAEWLSEMQYESAWRMGEWQASSSAGPASTRGQEAFHEAICTCLKAIVSGDRQGCQSVLQASRAGVVGCLSSVSAESAAVINPALVRLQMLETLSEAWLLRWPQAASTANMLSAAEHTWQAREQAAGAGGRFGLMEPLAAIRKVLLGALGRHERIAPALLQTAVAARKAEHLPQAMVAISELQRTLQADRIASGATAGVSGRSASAAVLPIAWRVEEAKLLWAQGQQAMALRLARALLSADSQEHVPNDLNQPRLLTLVGEWLSTTRSEGTAGIMNMMKLAVKKLDSGPPGPQWSKVACHTSYRLAQYADSLYRSTLAQKNSPEWATSQRVIRHKRQQMDQLQKRLDDRIASRQARIGPNGELQDRESFVLQTHIRSLQRPINADEDESKRLSDNELLYLHTALHHFHRCFMVGGKYDLQVVFRLVQLWFSLAEDPRVNKIMAKIVQEVPSHKFLILVYQMASRMSAARTGPTFASGFQDTLAALLERLATDHPYHTLYQLYALKNGNRGRDGKATTDGQNFGGMQHTVDRDKIQAASGVLARVARVPHRKAVVSEVGQMIEAYIELAALPAGKDEDSMTMPSTFRRSIKQLQQVPVVSKSVEVDPSCKYANLPHFAGFGDSINFVGGVNRPKLVQCFDSRGVKHKQLVKSGNDDLRQDAVMQQFFALVNNVLQASASTRKRQLHMVTYRVVPFTPSSGLLEWVDDTVPLSDYLIGKDRASGVHARYAKASDYTWLQCYRKMDKVKAAKPADKVKAFKEVCAHFTPCMHHFFLEAFREPAAWFEKRLAYTRSTAVGSIAGYIIGLGDRHSHNLLLSRRSAEVVHIDLGVAFEQGRFLNTPELMPFRLTRDIVDGMGITGVEGVMRRCCEETLRVLREHKESLLTIVEVFIHDPLFRWGLTPLGAQQRQKDDADVADGEVPLDPHSPMEEGLLNADAERALLRVKQKLDGLEGGEGEARGVEGQVQQLFQDAQDPEILAKAFVGWAAWV